FLTPIVQRRLQASRLDWSNRVVNSRPVVFRPYYYGLGQGSQRLGRLQGYRIYFKSSLNRLSLVRNDKMKIPFEERSGFVYKVKGSVATRKRSTATDQQRKNSTGRTRNVEVVPERCRSYKPWKKPRTVSRLLNMLLSVLIRTATKNNFSSETTSP
ncbi:hypothetical protein M514_09133, partial [Trichuris suis]